MGVLCGTCAFSDHHDFYPKTLPAKERLSYYAQFFPIVEIDSSFYGIPTPQTVQSWIAQVSSKFLFDIKAYRSLTMHNRGSLDLSTRQDDIHSFRQAVDVLAMANQLGVVLFQFPPWFIQSAQHMDYVEQLRKHFSDVHMAVEFRHRSWWNGLERTKTLKWLKHMKAVNVVCDEPQVGNGCIPLVSDVTHPDCTVFRLHGRNEAMWYQSGLSSSQERFDYHYTKSELAEFVPYVEMWAKTSNEVHILMNNNSGNDAITGALDWLELLDLPRRARPLLIQTKQLSLFDEL